MTTQLDTFEDGLLTALRSHVAEAAPARGRAPRRRRLVLAAAVATAAAAALLVAPGLGPESAYSVSEGNAGEVEVEVNRLEDAEGLEGALAEHGIRAEVTYVADGGECRPGRYTPIDRRGISMTVGSDTFQVTLAPGTVHADETLVIDASIVRLPDSFDPDTGITSTDHIRFWIDANVTRGPVPPCVPV